MPREIADPGWEKLRQDIHTTLSQFSDALGARECEHGDYAECVDNCPFDSTRPKANSTPMLSSWVLVAVTEDIAGDDSDIVLIDSPGQRNHTTKGMLHVALFE